MKKEEKKLKNIIVLLTIIIVILVGLAIFVIIEFNDERKDIRELYNHNNGGYNDNLDNPNSDDNNDYNNNYISREKALKIALDDVKLNNSDVYDIDIELDYKYNQMVYEIDFKYNNYEYEYFINALNGNIIKSFRERD